MTDDKDKKDEVRTAVANAVNEAVKGLPRAVREKVLDAFAACEDAEKFDVQAAIVDATAAADGRRKVRKGRRATAAELAKLGVQPTAVNVAAPGVPDFTGTPLGDLAEKHRVTRDVLAGAAVANGWGAGTELSDEEFLGKVRAWLGRPHGAHRARLLRLHRKSYEKAVKFGDAGAAASAEARLAELGDAAALSRRAADEEGK